MGLLVILLCACLNRARGDDRWMPAGRDGDDGMDGFGVAAGVDHVLNKPDR